MACRLFASTRLGVESDGGQESDRDRRVLQGLVKAGECELYRWCHGERPVGLRPPDPSRSRPHSPTARSAWLPVPGTWSGTICVLGSDRALDVRYARRYVFHVKFCALSSRFFHPPPSPSLIFHCALVRAISVPFIFCLTSPRVT